MRNLTRVVIVLLSLGLSTSNAEARKMRVKMATLAPDGSPWHEMLKDLGARWDELSNGEVTLKVWAGGVAGDEMTVVFVRDDERKTVTATLVKRR